ncbi:cysteine desulfurase [bacterium]|nr:cysteine desulfurase [bacterium]
MSSESPIYLDHNATTPVLPAVVEAMLPHLREHFGNPSSGHVYGQRAKAAVERAREQVAALVGAAPDEIVFTSGGTEANNLAIRGAAAATPARRVVVTSTIEHPATERPCRFLERQGWTLIRAGVDGDGCVRLDAIEAALRSGAALVSIMHANNETGAIQPLREISAIAKAHGALVHSDAAQSAGKIPVQVDELGIDLLSIAGHKLYAPKGIGALYIRRGTPIEALLLGASHERGLRPGTENVASIAGLGAACEIARETMLDEAARVRVLRDRLWTQLCEGVPGIVLNGPSDARLPNTLSVRFPGVRASQVLARAPEIAASTGSACHEGGETASAVITAMGVAADEALGTVRLSLGRGTTAGDIERAASVLGTAWRRLSENEV